MESVVESGAPQKAWITDIKISDGTTVQLPKSGIVIIVGPNNAGKSQSLRDIQGILRDSAARYQPKCVIDHSLVKDTALDIKAWAEENLPSVVVQGGRHFYVKGWAQVPAQDIATQWTLPRLGVLTEVFLLLANGLERLTIGNAEPAIDYMKEIPTGPIQRAYSEPELERKIGQHCEQAFGLNVVVDRYAGSVVPLRLGQPPAFEHDSGRPTKEYLQRLRELPRLEEQGDGIRSYMGLILNVLAGVQDMILIDEPEAFLHPPQARLLARTLGQRATQQQVFLATHSTAIVQGALEADNPTTIIRLTRKGEINHAAVLRGDDVAGLWSDPLLRYSNVLDGLFHDAVVLCESDSDCRYYQAVLDATDTQERQAEIELQARGQQFLFTHCGGKARLSSVLDALTAVKVPVVVVADFDLLREKADVEKLVKSAGGTFSGNIETNLGIVQNSLKPSKPMRKTALKDALATAINSASDEVLTSKDLDRIRAVARADNGWDKAKRTGKAAVPQGDAYVACDKLLSALSAIGILIVPVGELEGFERAVGGHGPAWVAEVLSQGRHRSPSSEARDFAKLIRDTGLSQANSM